MYGLLNGDQLAIYLLVSPNCERNNLVAIGVFHVSENIWKVDDPQACITFVQKRN